MFSFKREMVTRVCAYCGKKFLTESRRRNHCYDPECEERHDAKLREASRIWKQMARKSGKSSR